MVFFFLFSITGCGGGGGGGSDTAGTETSNQTADLQENLTSFNTAMDWVAEDLPSLMETVNQLNTALAEDDGSPEKTLEIGLLVDSFALDAAILVIDVEAMDLAEAGIQQITDSETSLSSGIIVTAIGVGLLIKGLYSFGKKMKEYSDDMSEARKDRDKAAGDLMQDKPGAEEEFNDAKKEMTDIGEDVTQEFATKVTTELVLGPINPTSVTGVILKDAAGNKVQEGLKVISATEECEDGYDSPGCKLGVDETDDADSAVVPDGNTTIVVGGKDMARQIIKEEIPPGSYTEVTIDPIPIKEATPQKIADSDNGVIGDDGTSTDPDDDDTPIDTDEDTGDDDIPVTPAMTLSAAVSSEGTDSITYSVAAAVSGITKSTSVKIYLENASTGSATKTLSKDGTVVWSVTVLDKDAAVTVQRNDTGEQQSLTLPGKTNDFDGTYVGTVSVTVNPDGICAGSGFSVVVSGSSISSTEGPFTGTLTGNVMSAKAGDWWIFSGSITNNVMSGTWYDIEGDCSGTFSATKQ
jgi:hypothetical protein